MLTLRLGMDFSRWTDTWWVTGRLLCKPEPGPEVADLVFHAFPAIRCPLGLKVWCVCIGVAANHLSSSFSMQRCHSQLQIKHSCFRKMIVWLCSISGGWNSDLINLCSLYCKMSLSCWFAFTVCMFFSRSNCENWIDNNETPSNFPHYVVLCTYTQHVSVFSEETIEMMLRSMRRIGGIICSQSSQQSCSLPTVRNNFYCTP